MGIKEMLGLAEEALGLTWGVKLKAIIDEIVVKNIELIPKENFQVAEKILKDLIPLIETQKFDDALQTTCGNIASAFKNANNLRGKFSEAAMIHIRSIKNMSKQALKGKKHVETIYKSEGKFRTELVVSLKKLAGHMREYALKAEAIEKTKVS
ncbi:hypothetical protein KY343_05890 [Candidatus Woesearchaeota archaeon]|nr:hypothetical protein [Candidatus Woesearchaeota archaeon]